MSEKTLREKGLLALARLGLGQKPRVAAPRASRRPWSARRAGGARAAADVVCVVEPGAGWLRVLVVSWTDRPTILGWSEAPANFEWPVGAGARAAEVQATLLERTLGEAEEQARTKVEGWLPSDHLVVGLPASQLRGGSWPVTQKRARPERPVDSRELETLLARGLKLATSRAQPSGEMGWRLVDAAMVACSIDGNGVTDPIGFKGEELGASVFAALARPDHIDLWSQVAERLEFGMLSLTAAPIAFAAGMAGAQGIAVDVGAEFTSLTWWRSGRPVAIGSVPVGGEALTDLLRTRWGLTSDRAETLKRTFSAGRLAVQTGSLVQDVVVPGVRAWLEQTEAALAVMSEHMEEPLPHEICLCGGGSRLPELVEAVRGLAYSRLLTFERYPEVVRLQPTDVRGVANQTDRGREAGDLPALALASRVARQLLQPPESLARADRILLKLCES